MSRTVFSRGLHVLIASVFITLAGCADDDASPAGTVPPHYEYAGLILNVSGRDIIRIDDGSADGTLFVNPDEVRPVIALSFLSHTGQVVETPPDSVVVILDLENNERFSLHPNSLPDPVFQWSFSIKAERLGATELRVSFLPEGTCKPATVNVQAIG